MSVDCKIIIEMNDEKEAEAVLEAIAPDNAPFALAYREGKSVTIEASSKTTPGMIHTIEDLLACLRIAEEVVEATK